MARRTSAREWLIAIAGGLALSAVLVLMLRPSTPDASAPDAPAQNAMPAAVTVPPSAPAPAPTPPAPAPAPAALVLRGILGGGAIFQGADGRQHLVRIGGMAAPGVRLVAIGTDHTEVESAGQRQRIAFPDAPVVAARPAPAANLWRLALTPVRVGGQIAGYRLDDISALPMLAAAGLRRGDMLISANGNALSSDEKVGELGSELAANGSITLAYERGGRSGTATVRGPS